MTNAPTSPSGNINNSSAFLSYARADDEPFAKRLHDDLTAPGFSVWWDRVSMPNRGLTFLKEIGDAVAIAERFILVAGEGAFKSDDVRAEWEYALSICKPVNVALRKCDYKALPPELAHFDAPDFRDDAEYSKRFETLLRQLRRQSAPPGITSKTFRKALNKKGRWFSIDHCRLYLNLWQHYTH